MEASYTPGDGLVVGAGSRWLLLGSAPDAAAVATLWTLLSGPRPGTAAVLEAATAACGPDVALVLVDLTVGAETSVARGGARHTTLDGVHTLDLGGSVPTQERGPARPLVGGVVSAASLVLRPTAARPAPRPAGPARPAAAPPAGGAAPLIDGIPAGILAATPPPRPSSTAAPDVPVVPGSAGPGVPPPPPAPPTRPPHPVPPPATAFPADTGDPDPFAGRPGEPHSSTVVRRDLAPPTPPPGPPPPGSGPAEEERVEPSPHLPLPAGAHLQHDTSETVLAVHCPAGHVTAAYHPSCRVCGQPVPPQEPRRMPRPRLGTLHLPDGERVPLDRGVVVGRQPAPVPGGAEWPHLVRLPPEATYVSRSHLSIELDGWLVMATDLGSRGGTTLRAAGRAPERIRGHEPYVWEPGEVLDLADSFEIVYEVTP